MPAISLLNIDDTFDFASRGRSTYTGERVPPVRPPAVLDADTEIPNLVEAEALVAEAQAKLDNLLDQRARAETNLASDDAARDALKRKVAAGQRISGSQVEKLSIERSGHEAALEIITEAVAAAAAELETAQQRLRRVLRHAIDEVIQILHGKGREADADITRIRQRSDTFKAWAAELHLGTQGKPAAADLRRVLGI